MSFSSISGSSGGGGDHPVQAELQSLLQQLGWSYVVLWSFNPNLRSLEWTGGHFRGTQSRHEIWKQQFFNFTHKACVFTPGQGSVGMAYAEQRNMWMNGPAVYCSAGSEQEAQFLQQARIQTAIYIPSDKSVLEIGTSENVAEDVDLMSSIAGFMENSILPMLPGHAVSQPPQSSHVPVLRGPMRRHNSGLTRRMSSLNEDNFLRELEEDEGMEEMRRSLASTSQQHGDVDILETTQGISNQAAFMSLECPSHSGITSSSLSSFEESSVKNSPDAQGVSLLASSSMPSSSAQRETPGHSPELHMGDISTTGGMGVQSFAPMVNEPETWPQMYMDMPMPLECAFREWLPTRVMLRLDGSTMNHCLMRRCFHFLRQIPIPPRQPDAHTPPRAQNFDLPGPHLSASSSSPENVPERDQAGPSRRQRQPYGRGRISPQRLENTEAAKLNHTKKERERRMIQKENFASLRRLVPIISKNDKASILSDAIIYLNVLHGQIQKLEEDTAEMESQHETLKVSHQELQERNKQLEDIVKGAGLDLPSPPK